MYAIVSPEKLQLPPGTVVRLLGTWQDYLALYKQRGEGKSLPRIKYRPGEILLMAPLPEHGREAHIVETIVVELLNQAERPYEAFTPITMKLPESRGLEPDYCFYIDNWSAVVGKNRIDWSADPPPDLVIEIDVTSYTDVNDYLPYRVPEVWLSKGKQLKIYGLQNDAYVVQSDSRFFPGTDIFALVQETAQIASERSIGVATQLLRKKLQQG
jgi:Uma2 family endonuclease